MEFGVLVDLWKESAPGQICTHHSLRIHEERFQEQ